MFRTRLELISYFIQALTGADKEACDQETLHYEDTPFILRSTCD